MLVLIPFMLSSCAQDNLIIKSNQTKVNNVFFQPWENELENNTYNWNDIFKHLAQENINQITLQWSQYGDQDLLENQTDGNLIETMIFFAKKYQIKIVFGLYHDPEYFKRISQDNLNLPRYLNSLKKKSLNIARQIISKYDDENIIAGFYIPQEIDDLNWQTNDKVKALSLYISSINLELNKISKNQPLYISGFYNQHTAIKKYVSMWNEIIQNNKSIKVLIQNGVGANDIPQSICLDYFDQFYSQLPRNQWGIIAELFTRSKKSNHQFIVGDSQEIKEDIEQYENKYKEIPISLFSLSYLIENNYRILDSIYQ